MGISAEELVARASFLYADDQLDEARAAMEEAFIAFRDVGDLRAAARTAARIGELHAGSFGNEAAGRGWLERGRRLLAEAGPCVE